LPPIFIAGGNHLHIIFVKFVTVASAFHDLGTNHFRWVFIMSFAFYWKKDLLQSKVCDYRGNTFVYALHAEILNYAGRRMLLSVNTQPIKDIHGWLSAAKLSFRLPSSIMLKN